MEETQNVQVGKWQKLPPIPEEYEISIGQRTVLYRGRIYAIFGASSQIFINCYDIEFKTWCQLNTHEEENLVQKSQYHSLVVHNNRIYMFAGTQLIGGQFYLVNRICYLDMNTHVWHKIDPKGTLPEPMYLHSGVVYENCLYTFGGKMTHEGNDCINIIYKFDFETETWTEVEAKGDIPSPRRAHGAAVYEDSMYIFGGWNGVDTFDDFYKFDFETCTWTQIEVKNGPQARQLDSMAQYGGKLYLYGGEGGKKDLNDFWSYDIEKNEWTEIIDDGKLVNFGRYANALVLDDNVLYLVGGCGAQALDDLYSITLPVVHKEHKPKTLFEKLQHDMKTLRLGQNAAFDFSILSKKKNLAVQGHKVIYAARAPALMKALHEQGHYTVDLSKKLINGLSEWIYEDTITAIEKYSLEQLHTLIEFAKKYEIGGLLDLVECEMMQRLDPDLLFDVDYSIITPRIRKMCRWIWHHNEDEYEEVSDEFLQVFELIELPTSSPSTKYTHTLSRDLLRIRQMTEYSDVIVKANDVALNLHLFMVNLRFPYFRGLIGFGTNKLSQRSGGFVPHEHSLHISFSAFNSIIDYVYSSEIIFEPQDYFPIASEASFYMIDDGLFYADLTDRFQQMITKENSKRLYEIASSYGSAFSDIMEYIASHYT